MQPVKFRETGLSKFKSFNKRLRFSIRNIMMKNQLFPNEIIENTQESNFSTHSVRSKIIYSTIVLSLIGLIATLPFISVDVGVRSQGIIRPVTEVSQIMAPVSGYIGQINVRENAFLKRGEIFATIEAPQLKEQIRFNLGRQDELTTYLTDLRMLQEAGVLHTETSINFTTIRYQNDFIAFKQQLLQHQQEVHQLEKNLNRGKILFESEAISNSELDDLEFSYQSSESQYKLLVRQQLNRWKQDELTYQNELEQLQSDLNKLKEQLDQRIIRSPISGTVQNLKGIFNNSFVSVNQVLAEITPDTNLVAEVYVTPRDIGMLREGLPARFQIDAYNYNQWGITTGKIESISTDIYLNENTPMFKVLCSVDQMYLELKNGYKGKIKKGMTFQARFIVNNRSLLQLLYDEIDDWINPVRAESGYITNAKNPK